MNSGDQVEAFLGVSARPMIKMKRYISDRPIRIDHKSRGNRQVPTVDAILRRQIQAEKLFGFDDIRGSVLGETKFGGQLIAEILQYRK